MVPNSADVLATDEDFLASAHAVEQRPWDDFRHADKDLRNQSWTVPGIMAGNFIPSY